MEVRKRENETVNSLIFRFTRRSQQTGLIREARRRRFRKRSQSRLSRKLSALHRIAKKKELERAKKLGIAP